MADHSKPTTTSLYSAFVTELDARCDDLALQLDPALTTATNLITGSIRWTSASNKWQKWNGTTWVDLSSGYAIPINGASVAATTLSASSTVSGAGFSTYLASPPAIGGTVAAAVTGTTVTASTQFSGPGTGLSGTAASLNIGGTAAVSTAATTTDDTTTATAVYPTFVGATSGSQAIKVASSKMTFVPSTGILSATGFAGAFNGTLGATTPAAATVTTLNKVTITSPATSATLTILNGKTATVNNTLTLAGTDGTTMTFPPASATIGYLDVPQNIQAAAYTLVLADAGKHIYHALGAAAATYTIPANASVAFPIGTAITFVNMATAAVTIAITTDTMNLAGAGTTGSRTLAQFGVATALKVTATQWLISGTGLT